MFAMMGSGIPTPYTDLSDFLEELNDNETKLGVKTIGPIDCVYMAEIIDKYDDYTLPATYENYMYVADYDYNELKNIISQLDSYKENAERSKNGLKNTLFDDFILYIKEKYPNSWVEYLKSLGVNATYIFYDFISESFSILKIGNASDLYIGETKDKEILVSNSQEFVKKYCNEIKKIDKDFYFSFDFNYAVTKRDVFEKVDPEKGKVLLKTQNNIRKNG